MILKEVYTLSKEIIDPDMCYIRQIKQDKFMAQSVRKDKKVVNEYVFKITKDNELKIIEEN